MNILFGVMIDAFAGLTSTVPTNRPTVTGAA
jgi:hypothetical protein